MYVREEWIETEHLERSGWKMRKRARRTIERRGEGVGREGRGEEERGNVPRSERKRKPKRRCRQKRERLDGRISRIFDMDEPPRARRGRK